MDIREKETFFVEFFAPAEHTSEYDNPSISGPRLPYRFLTWVDIPKPSAPINPAEILRSIPRNRIPLETTVYQIRCLTEIFDGDKPTPRAHSRELTQKIPLNHS